MNIYLTKTFLLNKFTMTFGCQPLVFLRDVYDHRHRFLRHALYVDDRVEFYESVNWLSIVNILNLLPESTRKIRTK